jgi:hypothetical protein
MPWQVSCVKILTDALLAKHETMNNNRNKLDYSSLVNEIAEIIYDKNKIFIIAQIS